MKKSELKQIIKEEISKVLKEDQNNTLNPNMQKRFNMIVNDLKKAKSVKDTNKVAQSIMLLPKKVSTIVVDKLIDMGLASKEENGFGLYYDDDTINENKINNSYVVKDEELSDEDGDFYVIDKKKAFEYLKQFNSKEVNAKQFIKDDEGWGEFEQYLENIEDMTDKELEDAMREEMSYYFYSKPDEI